MRCICFVIFVLHVFLLCCHTTALSHPVSAVASGISHMESGSKRSAWESKSSKPGIQIPFLTELELVSGDDIQSLQVFPMERFHDSSQGISLANLGTIKDNSATRTSQTCALICKGYNKRKLESFGLEGSRLEECVITIHDPVLGRNESRAVTLVNMALDDGNYIRRAQKEMTVEISCSPKIALWAEIRQSDSNAHDWQALSKESEFDAFIAEVLKSECEDGDFVAHRCQNKGNYLVKRLQVPVSDRDRLYSKSGKNSVTFRQARGPFDPDEPDLEIIKIEDSPPDTRAGFEKYVHLKGFLGLFCAQSVFYLRIQDVHLGEARQFIYGNSGIFNAHTMSMKLTKRFKVQGFLSGATVATVVETCASLSWHVVPLRIIHVAELAIAIVGSSSSPTSCRIPTNLGFLQVEEIGKRAPRKPRANSEFSSSSGSSDRKVEVSTRSSFSKPPVANPSSAQSSPPGSFMSPFASSLAGKVQALEDRMNRVCSDVKVLQKTQAETREDISQIKQVQEGGFSSLMCAINELKDMQERMMTAASSASTPIHSPPPKVAKF